MFNFRNDYNQDIGFIGSKIQLIATVDAIKELEFIDGCDGTIGLGNLIDIHIRDHDGVFLIEVIRYWRR